MPDLTIVTMQMCAKLEPHVTLIGGYRQEFGYTPEPTCTCPAYTFGKTRPCKHIKQAKKEGCSWHEQFDGPPKVDGVCPECGGPTVYVNVGV